MARGLGVGLIDLALLVVAADDGWMRQTEEHLQILTYLGVERAVIALTKSDLGEIDIVARRRQLLVFAEVKARASLDEAAEAVDVRQRRRIAAAAEIWLAANADDMIRDIRFDAILVAPGKIPRHIPAAFEAN